MKKSLPCWALLFLLLVLSLAPFNIGLFTDARPMFLLIGVFYWSLFRPGFLNYVTLFMAGIFYDTIADQPMGMTAIILMAAYFLTSRNRKLLLHQPFWILWLVFGVLALVSGFFTFVLNMVFLKGFVQVVPYLLDISVSFVLFPLLVVILKITNPPLALHLTKK